MQTTASKLPELLYSPHQVKCSQKSSSTTLDKLHKRERTNRTHLHFAEHFRAMQLMTKTKPMLTFLNAFDTCKTLSLYGIPEKLVKLMQIFYRNFSCSVGNSTTKLTVNPCSSHENLAYADDLRSAFLHSRTGTEKMSNLEQQVSSIGLSVHANKENALTNSNTTQQPIVVNNYRLEFANKFTYLGTSPISNEVQKRTSNTIGKSQVSICTFSCSGDLQYTPQSANSEFTRAMSSLCFYMAQNGDA